MGPSFLPCKGRGIKAGHSSDFSLTRSSQSNFSKLHLVNGIWFKPSFSLPSPHVLSIIILFMSSPTTWNPLLYFARTRNVHWVPLLVPTDICSPHSDPEYPFAPWSCETFWLALCCPILLPPQGLVMLPKVLELSSMHQGCGLWAGKATGLAIKDQWVSESNTHGFSKFTTFQVCCTHHFTSLSLNLSMYKKGTMAPLWPLLTA